jgi:hypothetical protein
MVWSRKDRSGVRVCFVLLSCWRTWIGNDERSGEDHEVYEVIGIILNGWKCRNALWI